MVTIILQESNYAGSYKNSISFKYTYSFFGKNMIFGPYELSRGIGGNIGASYAGEFSPFYSYARGHVMDDLTKTIMNNYNQVNYWSNPNVVYPPTGAPTGVEDYSDNARLWQEKRASLAAVGNEDSGKTISFICHVIFI